VFVDHLEFSFCFIFCETMVSDLEVLETTKSHLQCFQSFSWRHIFYSIDIFPFYFFHPLSDLFLPPSLSPSLSLSLSLLFQSCECYSLYLPQKIKNNIQIYTFRNKSHPLSFSHTHAHCIYTPLWSHFFIIQIVSSFRLMSTLLVYYYLVTWTRAGKDR